MQRGPTPNPPRRLPLASRNRPRPKAANLQHVDHAGSSGISLCPEWVADRPNHCIDALQDHSRFGETQTRDYPRRTSNARKFDTLARLRLVYQGTRKLAVERSFNPAAWGPIDPFATWSGNVR